MLRQHTEAAQSVDLEEAAASFAAKWCDTHGLKLTREAREDLEAGIGQPVASYRD